MVLVDRPFVPARTLLAALACFSGHRRVNHHLFKPSSFSKERKQSSHTMLRPPQPPTFPTPTVPGSSPYAPPPEYVYPPQTQSKSTLYSPSVCAICDIEQRVFLVFNHGIYPSRQSGTYPTPQPSQLPPGHRSWDPCQQSATYPTPQPPQLPPGHRSWDPYCDPYANTHAHASTYSSRPPHPSERLPSLGVSQPPSSIPITSVPGGYGASTNFLGVPPPPIVQGVVIMPTPGQGHNPHLVPYYNVPAPVITHQPSHLGMSGGTQSVAGDWSHRACIVYNVYQNADA